MTGNQVYLLKLVSVHAPGSRSAFSIRIRIQDSQLNADPDPQHSNLFYLSGNQSGVKVRPESHKKVNFYKKTIVK
jgi:hypothetical protein